MPNTATPSPLDRELPQAGSIYYLMLGSQDKPYRCGKTTMDARTIT